ncbi:MAG: hypothetical protein HETSPECPRED_004893 [Heterodermia speciosa]|uniref:Uncharacterized protein n=1 Tax=Heterodermia speciosa TaxID=116794 RepID=A0A8H3EEP1_9LECA|nr:MAG: hypothetical protein HETSPECPRED_004893 [Heterodermia speciosa]
MLFEQVLILFSLSALITADSCNTGFSSCSPDGSSSSGAPAIGSSLSTLYVDILDSINKVQNTRRELGHEDLVLKLREAGSLCCADGTVCLLLQTYNLPFCYDKFTTNYILPGGAYGTVVTGNYTASDGVANLLTGDYTLTDGSAGNVYGSASSPSKPDTATLTVPTQYTASGVGSAIPFSALGEWSTYTTTIPGTTIAPSTVPAQTVAPSVVSGSTVEAATTKPASTIPGTTVAPVTSTITTRVASASSTTSTSTSDGVAPIGSGNLILAALGFASAFLFLLSM